MPRSLFKLAASSLGYYALSELAMRNVVGKRNLRGILSGIVFILTSAAVGIFGIVALIVSLFFKLAGPTLDHLVIPAVITGGISLLVALLAFVNGLRRLRSPTRF
ncbi:MAG: hypothetical protein WD972_02915 [Candidatus Andersenbacteria bacterium]